MLYRFTGAQQERIVDLKDLYGGAVFLCGSHPSLNEFPLDRLYQPGIVVAAMNNAAISVRPDLWISADKAECYDKSILRDPGILKFARHVLKEDIIIPNREPQRWRHMPNMIFYHASDTIKAKDYLSNIKAFAWWRNVFMIAIQMLYYLGFRKIYLCGTKFQISSDAQYCYSSNLSDYQIRYNKTTYDMVLSQFKQCSSIIKNAGMSITSCTPQSSINSHVPYVPFDDAIDEALEDYPFVNTIPLRHSSTFRKDKI